MDLILILQRECGKRFHFYTLRLRALSCWISPGLRILVHSRKKNWNGAQLIESFTLRYEILCSFVIRVPYLSLSLMMNANVKVWRAYQHIGVNINSSMDGRGIQLLGLIIQISLLYWMLRVVIVWYVWVSLSVPWFPVLCLREFIRNL
jgi:hypothetical protein